MRTKTRSGLVPGDTVYITHWALKLGVVTATVKQVRGGFAEVGWYGFVPLRSLFLDLAKAKVRAKTTKMLNRKRAQLLEAMESLDLLEVRLGLGPRQPSA